MIDRDLWIERTPGDDDDDVERVTSGRALADVCRALDAAAADGLSVSEVVALSLVDADDVEDATGWPCGGVE